MNITKTIVSFTKSQQFKKRIFDIVVSLLILLIIVPSLLLITVILMIESGPPIMFTCRRYTNSGKEIILYKFRTMRVDAINSPIQQSTIKNDPRITNFGKFLRKTSLDELPQFINVLQGDLSIVGPRPRLLIDNDKFQENLDFIIDVKPGLTGWSQIMGERGVAETLETIKRRAELDRFYVNNWSIFFDFKIFALTVAKGFLGQNIC